MKRKDENHHKHNRIRNVTLAVLVVFSLVLSFYLSTALHLVLAGQMSVTELTLPGITEGIELIRSNDVARKLFFILTAVLWLGIALLWVSTSRITLRTNTQKILPDIDTPLVAGQNQYGSARWLKESEFPKHFGVVDGEVPEDVNRKLCALYKNEHQQIKSRHGTKGVKR